MKKKKIIIVLIVLILLTLTFFLIKDRKTQETETIFEKNIPSEETSSSVLLPTNSQNSSTITISGVKMKDFYKSDPKVNERGDVTLADEEGFDILYFSKENSFLISILGSPFESVRIDGEREFLNLLNINETEACKLDVAITTPLFANRNEAGKIYKLSFCE